jgi:peptidoglycan hydrolase-like protein with peptidoglycan-binding domain
MSILKRGLAGEPVKVLQQKLGVAADGQFGPGTEKAVKDFQAKNGLDADGLAGPATLAKMTLFKEITAEVVKKSEVAAGAAPSAAPAGGATPAGTPAAPHAEAPKRSIWGTIKSFFS